MANQMHNKKGVIIFDLDDTLFDTARLKEDTFLILAQSGISVEILKLQYQDFKHETVLYNFDAYVQFVMQKTGATISHGIQHAVKNMSYEDYVDASTKKTLDRMRSSFDSYLLSFGEKEIQEKKLRDSGLSNYFDQEKIIITQQSKEQVLEQIHFNAPVVFINDKLSETKKVARVFPTFQYIVIGKFSEQIPQSFQVVENIAELKI